MPYTSRTERLFDSHLVQCIRRQSDLYQGYQQGVDVDVNYYTNKIGHHRKMLSKYGRVLGISRRINIKDHSSRNAANTGGITMIIGTLICIACLIALVSELREQLRRL